MTLDTLIEQENNGGYVGQMANRLGLRAGKFLGSGICMMQQYYATPPQAGDHAWDADWGYIMWDGKAWHTMAILNEQNNKPSR